jgi:hypothetical protein
MDIEIEPVKVSYDLGDTINIDVRFNAEMLDRTTEQHFTMPLDYNYILSSLVRPADTATVDGRLMRVDSLISILGFAELSERYNSSIFRFSSGGSNLYSNFYFDEDFSQFEVSYSIKLTETGTYVLEHRSNIGDEDIFGPLEIEGRCPSAGIKPYIKLPEESRQNIWMLENSWVPYFANSFRNPEESGFNSVGSFVFRVE